MIGLFFLFAIGFWVVVAVTLGIKIPQWLGVPRYRTVLSVVLVSLIFVAPVADEIIAYPQMMAMCEQVKNYEYNEREATGKTISKYVSRLYEEPIVIFPGVHVVVSQYAHLEISTSKPVIKWREVETHGGFLGFPAGSSGDKMSLILPNRCTTVPTGADNHQKLIKKLQLVMSNKQPSNEKP